MINNNNLNVNFWKDSIKEEPCFIIGNGPSLKDVDLSILNPYFTIGINRAFLKIDPIILMWQDLSLWTKEKNNIIKTKAIKFCRKVSHGSCKEAYLFKLATRSGKGKSKLPSDFDIFHGRGSSGAIAFSMAYLLGCNPIILVGMDCKYNGEITNFYGKNKMHKKETLFLCNRALSWIKRVAHGRKVISCSNNDVFDNVDIKETILTLKNLKNKSREEWVNQLFSNK